MIDKCAVFIVLVSTVFAADTAGSAIGASNRGEPRDPNLLRDLSRNCLFVGTRPLTVEAVVLLTMVPSWSRHETNRPYRSWVDKTSTDRIFEYGDFFGNGGVHVVGALSLYWAGETFHKRNLAALGSDLTSGLLIAGAVSTGLKLVTERRRPDGAPYSFPSGHATVAFTTAGIIANRNGVLPAIAAEAGAIYVGLSRLQENKHYITDVVAGAALGNLIAYEVVARRKQSERLAISLEPSATGVNTALVYQFK